MVPRPAGQEVGRDAEPLVAVQGLDRLAGRDQAVEGELLVGPRAPARDGADELDATLLVPVTAQEALLLEELQVLVDRAVRRVAEAGTDLAMGGSDTTLPGVLFEELEDRFLGLGQVDRFLFVHGVKYQR